MGTHSLHGKQHSQRNGCLEDTDCAHAHFVLKLIASWHEWEGLKFLYLTLSVTRSLNIVPLWTIAMQRVVHEIHPEFSIRTSYYSDFFLLRTRVLMNGEHATIRSKEGSYEEPIISFCHGGSIKLWLIEDTILHKCGIYHVLYVLL